MKVRDLIAALDGLPGDADVLLWEFCGELPNEVCDAGSVTPVIVKKVQPRYCGERRVAVPFDINSLSLEAFGEAATVSGVYLRLGVVLGWREPDNSGITTETATAEQAQP